MHNSFLFVSETKHDSPGPSLGRCLVAGFPGVRVAGCAVLSPHVLLSPPSEASAPAAQVGTGPEASNCGEPLPMISRVNLACLPSLLICCIENRNTETKKKAVFLSLLLCLPKIEKKS